MELFVILLTTIIVFGHNGLLGWALKVEISPNEIDAITQTEVNISCIPSTALDQDATEIIILELTRQDGKPIALLRKNSGMSSNTKDPENYRVEGHISKVPSEAFLTLTLLNPSEEDTGFYQCVVYYLDVIKILKEKRAGANLTVSSKDTDSVVQYLVKKVSALDEELRIQTLERRQKETELLQKISTLEDKLHNQTQTKNGIVDAFSARYTVNGSENVGDVIVFNDVIVKVGQGYDETTGLYTAPRAGIYGFHVVAMLETTDAYIDLGLYVNSKLESILSIRSSVQYRDQSSISVFVQLKTGDVVKVAVRANISGAVLLTSFPVTIFTGYLFQETNNITATP